MSMGERVMELVQRMIMVLTVLVLFSYAEGDDSRPVRRRVDCRRYLFAPACRGITAKRFDPKHFHIKFENSYKRISGSEEEDINGVGYLTNDEPRQQNEYEDVPEGDTETQLGGEGESQSPYAKITATQARNTLKRFIQLVAYANRILH
ncbi:unnamed protein product [Owenia fusiformis]|uniref:Uncharacterized protein n=1 Tax=Owenia fusiformis TaxID=6347 RepID=A0A8J1Y2U6_OWEFU|nr:unnamed protein product [Owenia fusiformis]